MAASILSMMIIDHLSLLLLSSVPYSWSATAAVRLTLFGRREQVSATAVAADVSGRRTLRLRS